MKLTTMTDFVLNQEIPTYLQKEEFEEAYYKLHNYANFLKRLDEIWMFVPCDENGNVLEEPDQESLKYDDIQGQDCIFNDSLYYNDLGNYQQAKERCLFNDCKLNSESEYYYYLITKEGTTFFIHKKINLNIEYYIKYNLELTETALNEIHSNRS